MSVYHDDGQVRFLLGDVRTELRSLPDASVHCCVTSPPYWALRSYLPKDHPDKAKEIGLAESLNDYLADLVSVFREVRRVLRPDATLWLNMGDSMMGSGGAGGDYAEGGIREGQPRYGGKHASGASGLKPKDLCMVPARLALALQADGWWIRSEIIWCKTSCMPESVTDRPTAAHEKIYLLAASERYYYDANAVRQPHAESTLRFADGTSNGRAIGSAIHQDDSGQVASGGYGSTANRKGQTRITDPRGANLRNYWLLGPEPNNLPHYAAFPTEIPRRAILAGTSDCGVCPACAAPWTRLVERKPMQIRRTDWGQQAGNRTASSRTMLSPAEAVTTGWAPSCQCNAGEPIPATVLDPFLGSGTTALVAKQLSRRCIGVDLNPAYLDLAAKRCAQLALFIPTEVPA